MQHAPLIYSIFDGETEASHAVELLEEHGFPSHSILSLDRESDGGASTDFASDHFPPGGVLVGVATDTRVRDAQSALLAAGAEECNIWRAGSNSHGERVRSERLLDLVEEAGRESFPASDPPSFAPPGPAEK